MYSCRALNMDEQRLDDQQEPIYNSSVLIMYEAWKTSPGRLTIVMSGERGSGRSVQAAGYDDYDVIDFCFLVIMFMFVSFVWFLDIVIKSYSALFYIVFELS